MTTEQNNKHCGEEEGMHSNFKKKVGFGFVLLAVTGSLLLGAQFVSTLKAMDYLGGENNRATISVDGMGEGYAVPDIAQVSFSVMNESKTQKEAADAVNTAMKKLQEFLNKAGVEEKDIKTSSYDLYQQSDWVTTPCPLSSMRPCDGGHQVFRGFQITQSVTVKIHKLDNAGTIVGGLTENGATNISGLTFSVDNDEGIKAEVRKDAIDKAKAKAKVLAKQLGVDLVRIVSFNEGGNYPIYYGRGGMEMKTMSADAGAPAPTLPVGENKYTSNVTIVYEVR